TRFHALHQLMNRLRAAGATKAVDAIEPYLNELAPLLHEPSEPVLSAADAARSAEKLEAFKAALPRRVRAARVLLTVHADFPLLEFDTAAELLYRFVEDMHAYTLTYASLAQTTHDRERSPERYEPKTNAITAGVAGIRGAIVVALAGAFWIATAWPSGGALVFMGATVSALASSSPRPTLAALQLTGGAVLAAISGFIVDFLILPHVDGFPLLCAALAPPLAFGVFLSTRPKFAGYGTGLCIFFCVLAGPDNLNHYDAADFVNQALAFVLAMSAAALAFALLLPPSTPWMRSHLLNDLRRQVVLACAAPLARVRARFESRARDIAFQAHSLADPESHARGEALAWLVAVLEVGHAVIDLRGELDQLPRDPRYAPTMPWRKSIDKSRRTLVALFKQPGQTRLDAALAASYDAIAAVQQTLAAFEPPRDERRRLQRILSHLHFIRTALLDPESPLSAFAGSANAARRDEVARA
ncbi:MAG TPA: FUSC family protein, partial [Trinickia sp.]|nr:FUSC family protein [Trinickia sp.]